MGVPAQPTNFYVQQGDGQVYLSWDITSGAIGYSVQRSTDGVNFSVLSTPTLNNCFDTTVSVATLYYYQVAAVNGSGTGPYTGATAIVPALSGQLSLGELRQRAQQAADREGSKFLTLPEWNFNINQSAKEFYDLLITAYEDYFVAPRLVFTTTGATNAYPLPTGANYSNAPAFYKLYGVDSGLDNSSNAWVTLKKYNFIERNRYVYPQINSSILGVFNMEYRVFGSNINFIPTPAGNQYVGLWYFPRLKTMLADTDILDGIGGWTEYVIVDAALKALRKEESDLGPLTQAKMDLKKRIEEAAQNRDAGQPDTVSDTRFDSQMGYGSPNGDGSYGGW